jgi:hypothetical protein
MKYKVWVIWVVLIFPEHFMCPRNIGEMEDADSIGASGEPG